MADSHFIHSDGRYLATASGSSESPTDVVATDSDPFGLYIHVPFCASRCGYCDFNTYTAREAGAGSQDSYLQALMAELATATEEYELPAAHTVFFGGGTPSLLGADTLAKILEQVKATMGLAPGAEVTTEANPESTSPEFFDTLRTAGFTRISLGMQSTASHVLQILNRVHSPGRPLAAAREAQAAGFEHVNLDVIYGTPGESDDDLARTLESAVATGIDHVSAYSLIVEEGTALFRRIRHGEMPAPQEETQARRYEQVDAFLQDAGFGWYEVSNWARPGGHCRHNMVYWRDGDWWGAGPGAHGHLGDRRFVNVKLPARYSQQLLEPQSDQLPLALADIEQLDPVMRLEEKVMLGLRLSEGIDRTGLPAGAQKVIDDKCAVGLLCSDGQRVWLAPAGRLLADGIITDILLASEPE